MTNHQICSSGLCPYVFCEKFPKCNHLQEQIEYENYWKFDREAKENPIYP